MKYYATYVEYYTIEVEADENADAESLIAEAQHKLANDEDVFVDGQFESIIDENQNYVWEI